MRPEHKKIFLITIISMLISSALSFFNVAVMQKSLNDPPMLIISQLDAAKKDIKSLLELEKETRRMQSELEDIIKNTQKEFSFKYLFNPESIEYKNNKNGAYLLTKSSNGSPQYSISRQQLKKFYITSFNVNQCTVPIFDGSAVAIKDNIISDNCNNYIITEDASYIKINSIYETPISADRVSVSFDTGTYSIPAYNTIQFDKKHPFDPQIWQFDTKNNPPPTDRIIFFSPKRRTVNLLSLEKNISKNFTIHLSIEPHKGYLYAQPFIILNGLVAIDFGHNNGNSLHIRYKSGPEDSAVDKDIYTAIDKKILSDYYELAISKHDSNLKISIASENHTNGEYEILIDKDSIFQPKRWSTFSVGNTKNAPGFEIQSIMIVGRDDDQY